VAPTTYPSIKSAAQMRSFRKLLNPLPPLEAMLIRSLKRWSPLLFLIASISIARGISLAEGGEVEIVVALLSHVPLIVVAVAVVRRSPLGDEGTHFTGTLASSSRAS